MSDRDFSYVEAGARFIDKRFARWKGNITLRQWFPGDLSYSLQFFVILRDLHHESIPLSRISSLFTSFRIRLTIPARSSTLFSICISFISWLVISSVSFVQHQKDPHADSRKKIGIANRSSHMWGFTWVFKFYRSRWAINRMWQQLVRKFEIYSHRCVRCFTNQKFVPPSLRVA